MNWYKLYKFAFSRTKSQRKTMELSGLVFQKIKDCSKNNCGDSFSIDDNGEFFLRIFHTDKKTYFSKNFLLELHGNYSKKDSFIQFKPSIQLDIFLGINFSNKDFPSLQYSLYNAIRHELHHYWQNLYGNTVDSVEIYADELLQRYKNFQDYILTDQELEAYVKGLVFVAQKRRKPFAIVLKENLDELLFENNDKIKNSVLKLDCGDTILNIYNNVVAKAFQKAKQLFPQTDIK